MKKTFVLSILVLTIWSQLTFASAPIQGGSPVDPQDPIAKFTVAVGHQPVNGRTYCTGVLISQHRVLTAAHCLIGELSDFTIHFGRDAVEPVAVRNAVKVLPHPEYGGPSTSQPHDIAIIWFDGTVPKDFEPAELSLSDDAIPLSAPIELAGYGLSHLNELYKVTLPLESISDSVLTFENSLDNGVCHGDSGGPATYTEGDHSKVVGLTQGGQDQNGGCAGQVTYTRVDINLSWIHSNIK